MQQRLSAFRTKALGREKHPVPRVIITDKHAAYDPLGPLPDSKPQAICPVEQVSRKAPESERPGFALNHLLGHSVLLTLVGYP